MDMARDTTDVKRGTPLAIWAVAIIVLGLVFWGHFLKASSGPARTNPSAATHPPPHPQTVIPVGGDLIDGVFHPEQGDRQWPVYRTAAFSGTASERNTGSSFCSKLRISSKAYCAEKSHRLATT